MSVNRRAWGFVVICALVGMVGCAAPPVPQFGPLDRAVDAVWLAVQRGDVAGAQQAAGSLEAPAAVRRFRERAERDVEAIRDGRAAALVTCLDADSWLAARYDASDTRARERLAAARERAGDDDLGVLWLEEARRSGAGTRRVSAARAAQRHAGAGAEGLALEVETLMALGELDQAWERLEQVATDEDGPTARLALARRQLQAATGRWQAAAMGLLDDVQLGRGVPASLVLLEEILVRLPDRDLEARAREVLAEAAWPGTRYERGGVRLAARLAGRDGDLPAALEGVARLDPRSPSEDRWLARWAARLGGPPDTTLEGRDDVEPDRDRSDTVDRLRLVDEWNLVARDLYARALAGDGADLDDFVTALDAAGHGLPGRVRLADVPRHDYGLFGEMLDPLEVAVRLPGQFVLAGQALGLPAQMTLYDVEARREVAVTDGDGDYLEFHVRNLRVPGLAAHQGAAFQGAALDRVAFLDRDEIDRAERAGGLGGARPELAPRPAAGADQRRDLSEPYDVAERLRQLARAAAGDAYGERVLQTVALHEGKHIQDTRRFLEQGLGGQLWSLAGAGLLPGAVRAEVERRAQLHALRTCDDPRIALAQCLDSLPVEGSRRFSEHAVGYGRLVAEFVAVLDGGRFAGAPADGLPLQRDAVLVQQLHRLDPETIRAVALAVAE